MEFMGVYMETMGTEPGFSKYFNSCVASCRV